MAERGNVQYQSKGETTEWEVRLLGFETVNGGEVALSTPIRTLLVGVRKHHTSSSRLASRTCTVVYTHR